MPMCDVDRPLLLVALARVLNLVSREAFVEAVHAWARDASKPLDRVLLDRGALSSEGHARLTPMVEMHMTAAGPGSVAVEVVDRLHRELREIAAERGGSGIVAVVPTQAGPPANDPFATYAPVGSGRDDPTVIPGPMRFAIVRGL